MSQRGCLSAINRIIFFVSQVISVLINDDSTLMYDNDVMNETVFVKFDSPKVDDTYFLRLQPHFLIAICNQLFTI